MNSFAPGVFTIALPLPWELESVNVHLVELDDGFLLVDSGVATEECFDTLEAALKSGVAGRAIGWSEIRMLCLTHYHPDHIGLCAKILELSNARLVMHRVEAEYLGEVARDNRPPFYEQAMQNAGVPEEMLARIERAMRDVRRNFRRYEPDRVLEGGEKIPVRGGTLEAVWTPGHSPGHVCLYSPRAAAKSCGGSRRSRWPRTAWWSRCGSPSCPRSIIISPYLRSWRTWTISHDGGRSRRRPEAALSTGSHRLESRRTCPDAGHECGDDTVYTPFGPG